MKFTRVPDYTQRANALLQDFLHFPDSTDDLEIRLLHWATQRLHTATALSVSNYLSMVTGLIHLHFGIDLRTSPLIHGFTKSIRRLQGDHRTHPTDPMTHEEMKDIILTASFPINTIILLAWKRAGRVKDILELRRGGVWTDFPLHTLTDIQRVPVNMEIPFDKVRWAGMTEFLPLLIEREFFPLLLPFLSFSPPTSPPRERPLLFAGILTSHVTREIQKSNKNLSSRSIRRGTLQHLIQRGFTTQECTQLSLHRSLDGFMRYVQRPDNATLSTLTKIQGTL